MNITRKQFFRQGLLSLGRTALDLADTLKSVQAGGILQLPEAGMSGEPDPDRVACPDNQHCLARSCGCLACVERCEAGAILLVPGQGIRVDHAACTGCGTCAYVCPVSPKAVTLQVRSNLLKTVAEPESGNDREQVS